MATKANNQSQYIDEVASGQNYLGGNDMDYFYIRGDGNILDGGNGADTLGAWGGQNTILGGNGDDRMGAFSEQLSPPTDNRLDGGRGDDVLYTSGVFGSGVFGVGAQLTGGSGEDTFVLRQNSDVLTANLDSYGRPTVTEGDMIQGVFDVITDYQSGELIDIGVSTLRTDPVGLSHYWPGHSHLVLNDDEYAFIHGNWDGNGSFVVDAAGGDLMIVFDNDPSNEYYFEYNGSVILAGVSDPAIVNIGAYMG